MSHSGQRTLVVEALIFPLMGSVGGGSVHRNVNITMCDLPQQFECV